MQIFVLEKVKEFNDSLDKDVHDAVNRAINRLKSYGVDLGMPHSKQIRESLYELRVSKRQNVRIFYTFYKGDVFLLYGFLKKQNRISVNDLNIALDRLALLHVNNL